MYYRHFCSPILLTGALTLIACGKPPEAPMPQTSDASSSASDARFGEWRSLVELENWRVYQSQEAPTGWSVRDNALTKDGVGQDIVSRVEYSDFELELEWMLNARGNSGLFYRATEEYEKIYWSAPEFALLDDARHPDGRNPFTSAGAAHSLYAPPPGVVRAAGEWNTTRVVVRGTHVEHWLNGQKVVEYEYGSADFNERVAKSKFAKWPNFAKAKRGLIGIQGDHGGLLAIRGIRVRELR